MKSNAEIRRSPLKVSFNVSPDGGDGILQIPGGWMGTVVWGRNEDGMEHVSVSPMDERITPTWDDMCQIKDAFWGDEEEVYQIHPPKSEYVNMVENCLHLWRPVDGKRLGK